MVAPVCSPTRAALLSGRCWSRFGVVDPQNERAFPWDTLTLSRALRAAGYETCLAGKWHLGSHRYKNGPFTHTWHRDGKLVTETGHVTDLIAAEAVRWIESHARKDPGRPPYLLYVPFTAPHLPIREPDEWLARVPKGIAGEVPRHYAACVMHLDDAVGRILRAVDEAGTRDRTLFVFTSDNGGSTSANTGQDYPDDGCPAGDVPGDNRPFRGAKGDLYEGGVRVPTVVSWPGRIVRSMALAQPFSSR